MNLNTKSSFFKLLAIPTAILISTIILIPGSGYAEESPPVTQLPPLDTTQPPNIIRVPGALTSPPPATNPNPGQHDSTTGKYLNSAYSNLNVDTLDRSSVLISSSTVGTSSSSRSGLSVSLERWNGSSWELFGERRTTSTATNSAVLKYKLPVLKGYYYRIKSEHWSMNGDHKEVTTVYSSTLLVSS
ncbi:hypothetical protein [Saccharibacillus sp. JS10]|uniref:hypothetical protein n=1 Tax=Saccharibacillus sp. JS10 TaxID=2950552 RepID=UPI00210D09BB|nr:hypothetical protein [Saccharibacillus sp. JS10]MCQ4085499.1 hypothetical protein [Saccharibacillus sp. JS10]